MLSSHIIWRGAGGHSSEGFHCFNLKRHHDKLALQHTVEQPIHMSKNTTADSKPIMCFTFWCYADNFRKHFSFVFRNIILYFYRKVNSHLNLVPIFPQMRVKLLLTSVTPVFSLFQGDKVPDRYVEENRRLTWNFVIDFVITTFCLWQQFFVLFFWKYLFYTESF